MSMLNKLEKLQPPPFITLKCSLGETPPPVLTTRLTTSEIPAKWEILAEECDLLKSFILRKGTQLRLEKAMLLTTRVYRVVSRWTSNEAMIELQKFTQAFHLSTSQQLKKKAKKQLRVPSKQWATWTIYLILRDVLLLAKIKLECEHTFPYWLGLISCSHHPGDSLVIVAILARIWSLSSMITTDYISHLYPTLLRLEEHLPPTTAGNWPSNEDNDMDSTALTFPNDLPSWMEQVLGCPFEPATSTGPPEFMLDVMFPTKEPSTSILSSLTPSPSRAKRKKPSPASITPTPPKDDDEEDLGTPISRDILLLPPPPSKSLSATSTTLLPWNKFFKRVNRHLSSDNQPKLLLKLVKSQKILVSDPQIRVKLVKLQKAVKTGDKPTITKFKNKLKKFICKKGLTK